MSSAPAWPACVAAYRLTARRATPVDVYERWPGLGGQAATLDVGDGPPARALLPPPLHHRPPHRGALRRARDAGRARVASTRASAYFADGRQWPFVTPLDLLRFRPLPPLARVRHGRGRAGLQRCGRRPARRSSGVTARAWIERWMGRARLARRSGGRCCAASSASAPTTSRWSGCGASCGCAAASDARARRSSATRGARWEPLFERAARARSRRGGGRVLIDRPAARGSATRLRRSPRARPGSFRRGHDPRAFDADGEPERYDARAGHAAQRRLRAAARAGLLPEAYLAQLRGIEYFTALCLLLELDRRFSPFYWTNIGRRRAAVRRPDRAHEPRRARALRRPPLPLRRQLPAARPRAARRSTPTRCWTRYEPGLRRVNPAFSRDWVKQLWLHREPAAQPIVTVGYRERIPPLQTPRARARAGQHDADLSRGPRHQLRRPPGRGGRRGDVAAQQPVKCPVSNQPHRSAAGT